MRILSVCILLLAGCTQNPNELIDPGKDYFPDSAGHFVVFEVEKIRIDDAVNLMDTSRYQLMEVVADTYLNGEEESSQRIERYIRDDETQPWTIRDVWSQTITDRRYTRDQENYTEMYCVIPVGTEQNWDQNSFNPDAEVPMKISAVDRFMEINSLLFSECLVVEDMYENNVVITYDETLVFGKYVGLISHKRDSLDHQDDPFELDGIRTKGTKLKMEIIGFGMQ